MGDGASADASLRPDHDDIRTGFAFQDFRQYLANVEIATPIDHHHPFGSPLGHDWLGMIKFRAGRPFGTTRKRDAHEVC